MKKTAALLLLILLFYSCGKNDREIKVPGVVDGEIASIKALVGGTLDKLLIQEGQAVKKGDLIAEINRDRIRNALQELALVEKEIANSEIRAREKRQLLNANLAYWRKQVQRFERLQQNQSISGDQLEKARLQLQEMQTSLFDLDQSLAALQIQKDKLANKRQALELTEKDMLLHSPVSGVVLETFIGQGESVFPGLALADILDLSSLYIDVFVEEKELAALKLNQRAKIIVDGLEERSFSGFIAVFGKKAEFSPRYIVAEKERQALLYQVKVRIDRDLDVFKIGMPVTVVFARQQSDQ
ncbi:MAG: efflux RND transporter periplasmic adaptor subunit [Acidobacteria bacterium]|nr:efflux RND transporter periplasmic adaptor subunit [Acidobacteriota bacterium]MBU4306916.1 efflux RND transporter periplasmic adaptor subunit [Acidobacteriota bacterium]MCG2812490.1 efflux RND transporter periplasmic adaptor subunit [Candidatus Aminicenantes bacterium]